MGWPTVFTVTSILVIVQRGVCSGSLEVFDSCSNSTECPDNSECLPMSCDGKVCLCKLGYVPSVQLDQCYTAAFLDDPCDNVRVLCRDPNAHCSQGQCKCRPAYVPAADNLRCKSRPMLSTSFALLREFCDPPSVICQDTAINRCDPIRQQCVCREGWREATEEELNARPFVLNECRRVNFSLNAPVDDLDCPVPDPPVSARVGEPCISFNNCPANAECLPRGCDGDVCVCEAGFYPSNNRTACKPVSQLGDVCDDDTVCYTEGKGSGCHNGQCVCSQGLVQTHDGRCKPEPDPKVEFALLGEECGIMNSKRVVCYEEGTTCNSTMDGRCVCRQDMRMASAEEIVRDPFNPSPCRFHGYQLDTTDASQCEREKLFKDCLDWERGEPFWREWFRGGRRHDQRQPSWHWPTEWKKHRDLLRECSKLKPAEDGDNWSEEHRESRHSPNVH